MSYCTLTLLSCILLCYFFLWAFKSSWRPTVCYFSQLEIAYLEPVQWFGLVTHQTKKKAHIVTFLLGGPLWQIPHYSPIVDEFQAQRFWPLALLATLALVLQYRWIVFILYYSYPEKTVHSTLAKIYYFYHSAHPRLLIMIIGTFWDPEPLGSDLQLWNKSQALIF